MSIQEQAAAAIGADAPKDWRLRPRSHAQIMKPEAGALARILQRPDFEEIIDTYTLASARARQAQNTYKFLARASALSSFFAIVIAAVLLLEFGNVIDLPDSGDWILSILPWLQGMLLLFSFLFSFAVSRLKPFERWMSERAAAEHQRLLLFNRVTAADEQVRDAELPLLPLKLEYFRRYQLDVQKKYYSERGGEHERALLWSGIFRFVALLCVCSVVVPVLADIGFLDLNAFLAKLGLPSWQLDGQASQRLVIALSTVGAALQGWLAAKALINQDQRNSVRYKSTLDNLQALSERPLDEARHAAEAGVHGDVHMFIALVQEQISSEHREWVSLRAIAPNLELKQLTEISLPHAVS